MEGVFAWQIKNEAYKSYSEPLGKIASESLLVPLALIHCVTARCYVIAAWKKAR